MFAPPKSLFDEITDFLASAPSAEEIIAFRPSEELTNRLQVLQSKNSDGNITAEEYEQLTELVRMNHFLRMLVAKTRLKSSSNLLAPTSK